MARLFDQILGHSKAKAQLVQAIHAEHMPQSLLIVGPSGIGKAKLALAAAQALLCENQDKPCGACGACHRVSTQRSESLHWLKPEKNQMKIELARDLIEKLSLQSWTGRRVVVIEDAHLLNPQAANALLKSIEEPPAETYFILTANSKDQVLRTIRSRCQILSLTGVPVDLMRQKLSAPEWVLRASLGRFDRAEELMDKSEVQLRQTAMKYVNSILSGERIYLSDVFRSEIKDRESARSFLIHVSFLLRDYAFVQIQNFDRVFNQDLLSNLKALPGRDVTEILELSMKALRLEKDIANSMDSQLNVERFWIEARDVLA
jgi:DNA polymerase-3 subunit delta'